MRAANDNDRYFTRRIRTNWFVFERGTPEQHKHVFTNPKTGKLAFYTEKDARAFLSTLRAAARNIRLA